jgi:hypothetical protein
VTWTLLSVPLATVDVGDSCALWTWRVKEIEFLEFRDCSDKKLGVTAS